MADHIHDLAREIEREIQTRQAQLDGLRKLFPGSFSKNGQAPDLQDPSTSITGALSRRKPGPKPTSVNPASIKRREARARTKARRVEHPRKAGGPPYAVSQRADTMIYPPDGFERLGGSTAIQLLMNLNADKWMTGGDLALMLTNLGWFGSYPQAAANVAAGLAQMDRHNRIVKQKHEPDGSGARWEYRLRGLGRRSPATGIVTVEKTDDGQTFTIDPAPEVAEVNPDTDDQAKYYGYVDYLAEVGTTGSRHPEWRLGQVMFNTLAEMKPIMAEMIRGSSLDPFHADNRRDVHIERFLAWVERNWDLDDKTLNLANPQLAPKEG